MNPRLDRYAWLSIAAALLTLGLKLLAWQLTGSVGLLSDALESLVNLSGAVMALWMLRVAAQPPDEDHAYGHDKAEYFSSGFEGMLIFIAGGAIAWAALPRLLDPQPIAQPALGLLVAALASGVNLAVSLILMRAAVAHRSEVLRANALHLRTDVWTSAGIIGGVVVVAASGWQRLDPLIALAVAAHILWTGFALVRESAMGLMDSAWPAAEREVLQALLQEYRTRGIDFHAVRTRRAAARRFVSFHMLVPGAWSVQQAHNLAEELEHALSQRIERLTVFTHLEPLEDPIAYQDIHLERHG